MAIDGSWEIVTKTPMGDQDATLVVTSSGSTFTGTIDGGPDGELPINDGRIDGDDVSWKIDVTKPLKMTVEFSGSIDGDSISGKAKAGPFGSSPFSGTRA